MYSTIYCTIFLNFRDQLEDLPLPGGVTYAGTGPSWAPFPSSLPNNDIIHPAYRDKTKSNVASPNRISCSTNPSDQRSFRGTVGKTPQTVGTNAPKPLSCDKQHYVSQPKGKAISLTSPGIVKHSIPFGTSLPVIRNSPACKDTNSPVLDSSTHPAFRKLKQAIPSDQAARMLYQAKNRCDLQSRSSPTFSSGSKHAASLVRISCVNGTPHTPSSLPRGTAPKPQSCSNEHHVSQCKGNTITVPSPGIVKHSIPCGTSLSVIGNSTTCMDTNSPLLDSLAHTTSERLTREIPFDRAPKTQNQANKRCDLQSKRSPTFSSGTSKHSIPLVRNSSLSWNFHTPSSLPTETGSSSLTVSVKETPPRQYSTMNTEIPNRLPGKQTELTTSPLDLALLHHDQSESKLYILL